MELLKFFLKEAPEKTLHILILSVMAGMSEVASVLLTINGVQDVAAGRNYMLYAILLPTAALVFILSKRISQTRAAALTESILEKLYTEIADDIRHAELPEIEQRDAAGIYLKMLKAQTVTDAATRGVHAFQSLFAIFFLWFYLFRISPMGGLISLLIFTFAVAVYELFQQLAIPLMQQETEKEQEVAALFGHILYGAKEIRISRPKNDDLLVNQLAPIVSQVKETRTRALSYFSQYWIFIAACFHITLAGVAFFFPAFYSNETALSVIVIGYYVWNPLLTIVGTLPGITEGKAAMEELCQLAREERITRENEPYIYDPSEERTEEFSELTLRDIGFVYESLTGESGFSVNSVSFTAKAGEIILIAGGNGSGKTTLMKVLTGLYPPSSGEIRIDGNPVSMNAHRHLFSTVFSDFHLFDAIYGADEIDDETVHRLLAQTDLSHKTRWLAHEKRFGTTHLSSGQRKRLALVVSLLEDKPVYVFDEWAADQDPHFRRYFYETLLPSMKKQGKTVIAVSHDDRYFHIADRLIRMEYGQMASCSAPDDEFPAQQKILEETVPGHNGRSEKPEHRDLSGKFPSGSEDKRETERKGNRITELLRPSLRNGGNRLIFNGILSVICQPVIVSIIFLAANLPYGESRTRLFLLFLISLVLLLISFQRFITSLIRLTEERIADIRLKVMEQIRHTDLYSFEKTGIENIRTALTYDMKSVSEVSSAVAFSFRSIFNFTGLLFFMATLSLTAFFMTVFVTLLGGVLFAYNQVMIRQIVTQVRDGEKRLFDAVTDILDGFKELKLSSRKSDDFFHKSFKVRGSRLRKLKLRAAGRFTDIYILACGLWQTLFILAVLTLPLTGFLSGNTLMTFVGVVVCLPVGTFADHIPRITLSSISMQRLHELGEELMHLGEEGAEPADETDLSEFAEIRYENLSFEYEEEGDRPFSVGPLNLSFRAGEIVFIVGGNGSGKSTLMKMLTGLYPVRSGTVFLNGEEIGAARCRSLFSAIFYDFHLFDRLYGLEDIDADRVNDLLRLMRLEDKVQFDGDRFSTLDLSTGQRKRLAMVAAMMEDKPIYMFDEWAADQDPHFRKYFYETLLPSFRAEGRTVIAVSHDDRYFHVADRVIRLDYGQIAAEPDSATSYQRYR